ncbi:phosphoglucomutase, alpha-D-glucose phosphate-specific [Gluconacetobacter diazotrophicus PA1 5]|uniref:phosphoglucomutase (alpha-D-glucose-1,6-bisphosphate-dependent) n=1 Tax=Gluconacetobacter diazotrophicus TaxID=33996 RepID=UPI000173D485|nr:phosphoglucomutase (alpha-D-glucose-1,6-bisphosphate-dependent) [Gluconacetobacter diazotrophicus]ACI52962.1 phosphoglucomutase, alpha-D-glucose phosphate-specific [Gluconacetobacter diazotrophicus PA1 5]TWB00100.1 phosphoglucomutase [Gluconacetobacter diazotrophicus]
MATISPLAGKPVAPSRLIDVAKLTTAYYDLKPDPRITAQRVTFGTSGHRGSPLQTGFNEAHILAISQAVCEYRAAAGIDGPLYIGIDTHAISKPALASALEVFAANGVDVFIDAQDGYTPTPVISHAILTYNKGRTSGLADGVVLTPSHNPPEDGGYKYNPPHGGPADTGITRTIERAANDFLASGLAGVRRIPYEQALRAACVHRHDYITPYVADLGSVLDMAAIRASGVKIGIDPLGGAAVAYWQPIIERYGIDATVVSDVVDPTFSFMTADWDGQIRMDCSSPYAMGRLIEAGRTFDVAFANDTDADRHGIVAGSDGLMTPNHYLATAIAYLFANRPGWSPQAAVGKTVVSSSMIDRVAGKLGRRLVEVPVGFKWFVDGLIDGSFGFAGEESAGASFLRTDGTAWTTDKDGIILGLLAAEMTARTGHNPGVAYRDLTAELGTPYYARIDAPATAEQKSLLKSLSAEQVGLQDLAGEPIRATLTRAPGNDADIGGLKIVTDNGWFAARPSGTEDVYKIYAESFVSEDHLHRIQHEAADAISSLFATQEGSG